MRRRLAQVERVMWAVDGRCLVNIAVAVRVMGSCAPQRVREAVEAVRHRHPLLAVRLDRPGPLNAWLTTDGIPEVPVKVVEATGEDDWIGLVEAEVQRPFDLMVGPLARFLLVTGAGYFDLVVVCHHAVTDGMSTVVALRDVLRHLTNASIDLTPVEAGPAEDLMPAHRPRRQADSSAGGPAPKARQGRPTGSAPCIRAGQFAVLTWSLGAAESGALRHRCRREETTVYAALCVAFLRAFAELDGVQRMRWVQTPVSIRHLLSVPAEAFGFYITQVDTSVDMGNEGGFWATARTFKADLNSQVAPAKVYAQLRGLRRLRWLPVAVLRLLGALVRFRFDLSVTNLGRVAMPLEYGPLRVRSLYAIATVVAPDHRVLAVSSLDDQIFFSLASFERELMERLRKLAMAHLADAVG